MALDLEAQYEKIFRYCWHRLGDRDLAEDLTQETFLRWFASDTYRSTGQTLQYLYRIARNLCISEYRRPHAEPLPEDLPAPEEEPLDRLALRAALERLSPEDRELVLLRYVNEEPAGVLCRLYGISRFALYRRLRRILNVLRDAMKE